MAGKNEKRGVAGGAAVAGADAAGPRSPAGSVQDVEPRGAGAAPQRASPAAGPFTRSPSPFFFSTITLVYGLELHSIFRF